LTEPIVAYNLFLTAIIVPFSVAGLGWYLNRIEKKRCEREEEKSKLMEENKRLVEKEMFSWRERFSTALCSVKTTIEKMDEKLDVKRNIPDCSKMNDDIWNAIDKVRARQYNERKGDKVEQDDRV